MNVVYNVTSRALGKLLKLDTRLPDCAGPGSLSQCKRHTTVPCTCAVAGRRNRQRIEAKLGAAAVH